MSSNLHPMLNVAIKAARAAGFTIFCMSYGYNHGQDIRDYHPDAVLDALTEVKRLLAGAP